MKEERYTLHSLRATLKKSVGEDFEAARADLISFLMRTQEYLRSENPAIVEEQSHVARNALEQKVFIKNGKNSQLNPETTGAYRNEATFKEYLGTLILELDKWVVYSPTDARIRTPEEARDYLGEAE